MKIQYNEEKHRNDWVTEIWYEKWAYVIGVIFSIFLLLGFIVGFIQEL